MTANRLSLPRLIGHRGLAARAPENTLAGVRAAHAHGITMIEFDVRLSRDGVPMVFHDDTLERTSNGHGVFAGQDAATLSRLDAGRWFSAAFANERIPRLDDLLRLCRKLGLGVNIELKPNRGEDAATAHAVALALEASGLRRNEVLVSSFNVASLEAAARALPDYPRGLLLETPSGSELAELEQLGCHSINVDARAISRDFVIAMQDHGYAVLAYTVNEQAQAEQLWHIGVDAVFSDEPLSTAQLGHDAFSGGRTSP